MKNKLLLILSALLILIPSLQAIEMRLIDRNLTDSDTYKEDYLFSGEILDFRGTARDLFFFCETLDFSGNTKLALNGLAHDIYVRGDVKNGVKAAGRYIDIIGSVTGTSFLAGEKIVLGRDGRMEGDTFIGARKITILGKHIGNLNAGAGEISIQNKIEGDVDVYTGQLQIGEQGQIVGNLTYHSDQEISEEEASRVTGNITFEKKEKGMFGKRFAEDIIPKSIFLSFIFKLSYIVFGLLILLFPICKLLEERYNRKEILSLSLWGLIPVFVYPSAIIVSILLVITLPLAAALALAFMPVLFITKALGLTMIGGYLAERFNLNTNSRFLYFLMAVIPYSLLALIPFFGALLLVFVSSIGCGLLLSKLFNKKLG